MSLRRTRVCHPPRRPVPGLVHKALPFLLAIVLVLAVGLLSFVLEVHAAPSAAHYYVDSQNGSDDNPGTLPERPWRTLERVQAQQLGPGDVISLARGSVWTGELRIDASGAPGNPITFTAYGQGDRPVLRNPGKRSHAVVVGGSWVVLEGLLIRDASYCGVKILEGGDHNVVRDCEITQVGEGVQVRGRYNLITGNHIHDLFMVIDTPGGEADYGAVAVELMNSDNEVSYNRFVNCIAPSHDFGEDGGAVELWGNGDNSYIHHNWATGNHGFIEIAGGSARNVTLAYNIAFNNKLFLLAHLGPYPGSVVENLRIEHNTIVELTLDYHTIIGFNRAEPDQNTAILRNNIIYTNSRVSYSPGFTRSHNLYYFVQWGNLGIPLSEGERVADPKFVNLEAWDLHLQPGSPAIDSAVQLAYTMDYDGQPLPLGDGPDIGALERMPVVEPVTPTPTPSPTPGKQKPNSGRPGGRAETPMERSLPQRSGS